MKYIKLILLLLVIFLTTGCVSYTELNELGIIDMILIDKDNDNYIVTINMITPSKDEIDAKKTAIAYRAAQQARFEHGETPVQDKIRDLF